MRESDQPRTTSTPVRAPRPIGTYAGYRDAMLELITHARAQIVLFDVDLKLLDLEAPATIDALEAFVTRTAVPECLRVVVHRDEFMENNCPRLVRFLTLFGHRVSLKLSAREHMAFSRSFIIVDEEHSLVRFHADRARGSLALGDAATAARHLVQFEMLWERGRPSGPKAPLGL